jgi:hypothetical protein
MHISDFIAKAVGLYKNDISIEFNFRICIIDSEFIVENVFIFPSHFYRNKSLF